MRMCNKYYSKYLRLIIMNCKNLSRSAEVKLHQRSLIASISGLIRGKIVLICLLLDH